MRTWREISLLTVLCVCAVIIFGILPAIPQDPAYHLFADTRSFCGISNFSNVLSNLPYFFVGGWGLWLVNHANITSIAEKQAYYWLFSGVFLVGAGSAYYHMAPDSARLLWDRLPMTIAFMALVSLIIMQRVSLSLGRMLLPLLLTLGFFSVGYWYWGETQGTGDLRLYILVQFAPLLLLPCMLLLYPSRYAGTKFLWLVFLWYAVAKLLELWDYQTWRLTGEIVSGHTIKHLIAALAAWQLVSYLRVQMRNG